MKRSTLFACLALAALALVPLALARDIPNTKLSVSDGGAANVVVGCGIWAVQCDAAACVASGDGGTFATCTLGQTSTGVTVQSGQLYDVPLPCGGGDAADTVSIAPTGSTANCQVFKVSL